MSKQPVRSRAFCFTINNYTYDDIDGILDLIDDSEYLVFGFEIGGKLKTPHIQGYVYFNNPQTRRHVNFYLKYAYIAPAKGTPDQNFEYCSKDGEFYEYGVRPHQGRAKWEKVVAAMENPRDNIQLYMQYRKAYKEIVNQERKVHERKLIMIPYDKRYEYASKHESVTFDHTLDTYNGEDAIMVICFGDKFVLDWVNGYPQSIKRGYEVVRVDPEYVYLLYADGKEYNYFFKRYEEYFHDIVI